ncbi:Hypothetical predicted protein [Mytilus galloprovincialis]|uniref:AIG1-type G domain-containing protein n=1 Tax=Mytilus galloprovincialis TaxID=29158 RepID=A0A8B6HS99_MYTGA|nr:Hypothetical predicted protein [Mytilus galloprovincialis]
MALLTSFVNVKISRRSGTTKHQRVVLHTAFRSRHIELSPLSNTVQQPSIVSEQFLGQAKLRILLFGLQGSGVSSTANTIVGEARFKTGLEFKPVTTYCKREACEVFGRKVEIIDTPGFPNEINVDTVNNAFSSLKLGFEMLAPGPNVFLLILPIQRYSDDSKLMVECLDKYDDIRRHVIVIFTCLDKVEQSLEKTKQDVIASESLRELLQFASGRFILFNNRIADRNQVKNLLGIAEEVVMKNCSNCIDSRIFNERSAIEMNRIVDGKNETWGAFVLKSLRARCNIL